MVGNNLDEWSWNYVVAHLTFVLQTKNFNMYPISLHRVHDYESFLSVENLFIFVSLIE